MWSEVLLHVIDYTVKNPSANLHKHNHENYDVFYYDVVMHMREVWLWI